MFSLVNRTNQFRLDDYSIKMNLEYYLSFKLLGTDSFSFLPTFESHLILLTSDPIPDLK